MTNEHGGWQVEGDLRRGIGGKYVLHPVTRERIWVARAYRDGVVIYVGGEWKISPTAKLYNGSVIVDSTIHHLAKIGGDGIGAAVVINSEVNQGATISSLAVVVNSEVGWYARVGTCSRLIDSTLPFDSTLTDGTSMTGAKLNIPGVEIPEGVLIDTPNGMGYMQLQVCTHSLLVGVLAQTPAGLWLLTLGCWSGTLREFENMIASDSWVSTKGARATRAYRPKMKALIADMKQFIEGQEADPVHADAETQSAAKA